MVIYAMTMEILWNWREYKTTTETWGMSRNLTKWRTLTPSAKGPSNGQRNFFSTSWTSPLSTVPSFSHISFFLPFLVWPLLPTQCRCRGLLLHLTTLNRTPLSRESCWVWWGAPTTLYLHNTQHSQKTNIYTPKWDINLLSKQVRSCRPKPNTTQPKGSASFSHLIVQNYHTGHSDLGRSGT